MRDAVVAERAHFEIFSRVTRRVENRGSLSFAGAKTMRPSVFWKGI